MPPRRKEKPGSPIPVRGRLGIASDLSERRDSTRQACPLPISPAIIQQLHLGRRAGDSPSLVDGPTAFASLPAPDASQLPVAWLPHAQAGGLRDSHTLSAKPFRPRLPAPPDSCRFA